MMMVGAMSFPGGVGNRRGIFADILIVTPGAMSCPAGEVGGEKPLLRYQS